MVICKLQFAKPQQDSSVTESHNLKKMRDLTNYNK